MTSRSKLASLIDTVYSLEPQAIAVDFMFHSPQDSVADKTLVETVRRVRDKTVFAYMLEDYQAGSQSFANAKHSFFLDPKRPEWYCDSVMEGYANMKNDGTSEPVWLYSVVEKEGNKNVCSLPAMLLGEDLFVDSIPHQEYVINYKGMDVNIISPDEITLDHIKDHMVMIGAYEYSGDKFDTPLGMLPGMMVHTYIIQSLTGDSIVEQSPTDELLMTAISLLLLMMAMLLTDVLVEFLITKVHLNFFATVLEGIFSSVVMGILAVILLKAYSYHLLMDENVFTHGQAAFNGILIAAAILKVLYAATIQSLCRNKCLPKLTHYSIYSKFQSSQ